MLHLSGELFPDHRRPYTAFASMILETHSISPDLQAFVEAIFHYRGFQPDHSIERVVPTGHVFLIFELDGIPRNTYSNDTLVPQETYREAWISGMHKRYLSISAHQDSEMFVIQFKATGAFPFLHFPIHQINEKVVQAAQILGQEVIDLRQQLMQHEAVADKFQAAENWLLHRFDLEKAPPAELLDIVQQLAKAPALTAHELTQLVQTYPFTQKHLIAQFKKYLGLTPKNYQRILRFNEILAKIYQKKRLSWTQISYDCGYTDQSHFIKEFKYFSGFNPQEFLDQNFSKEEPNFFPLDREG